MDYQKKLEILVAYDFSLWRKIQRAKKSRATPPTEKGFGNVLWGMSGAASSLAGGRQSEEYLDLILCAYETLAADYATISFDELDPNDTDFRFLFDYKKRLDELGRKIEVFVSRTRANGMRASKDWPEYNELDDSIGKLMNLDYRTQVLDRNGIMFSEPTS